MVASVERKLGHGEPIPETEQCIPIEQLSKMSRYGLPVFAVHDLEVKLATAGEDHSAVGKSNIRTAEREVSVEVSGCIAGQQERRDYIDRVAVPCPDDVEARCEGCVNQMYGIELVQETPKRQQPPTICF